jgi:hypothetical protein
MWFNPVVIWLLRSPFHSFMSKNTMLVVYTGQKSGRLYTVPVNYFRMAEGRGGVLLTTSKRDRVWWRSLRGGAPVEIWLQGKHVKANAEAVEDAAGVRDGLIAILESAPKLAKYFDVTLDHDSNPNPEDVARASIDLVIVRTYLS